MAILDTMRSFFSTKRGSIENPSTPINGDTLGALFQRGSAAGVAVDEYAIIGLPAFYRATQILGGVIASIPFDSGKGSCNNSSYIPDVFLFVLRSWLFSLRLKNVCKHC